MGCEKCNRTIAPLHSTHPPPPPSITRRCRMKSYKRDASCRRFAIGDTHTQHTTRKREREMTSIALARTY